MKKSNEKEINLEHHFFFLNNFKRTALSLSGFIGVCLLSLCSFVGFVCGLTYLSDRYGDSVMPIIHASVDAFNLMLYAFLICFAFACMIATYLHYARRNKNKEIKK